MDKLTQIELQKLMESPEKLKQDLSDLVADFDRLVDEAYESGLVEGKEDE
jgi:hypothetical protein